MQCATRSGCSCFWVDFIANPNPTEIISYTHLKSILVLVLEKLPIFLKYFDTIVSSKALSIDKSSIPLDLHFSAALSYVDAFCDWKIN